DALVLATPSYDAASLIEPLDAELGALLRGIPYVSTATISLGFPRKDFSHRLDGYGFVVPRMQGLAQLSVTWTSSNSSDRARDTEALAFRTASVTAWPRQSECACTLTRACHGPYSQSPVKDRAPRWPTRLAPRPTPTTSRSETGRSASRTRRRSRTITTSTEKAG